MKSFTIVNGDLTITGGDFATVEGPAKVQQDLGLAVREPYGTDRFHPKWGSVLDNYIGITIGSNVPTLVDSEIRRIIANYVAIQQSLLTQTTRAGQPPMFSTNEIIVSVDHIDITQIRDTLRVMVFVMTLARQSFGLETTVGV